MPALITSLYQVGGGSRRVYAQDAHHAARALEILRADPTMIDHLHGVDGIRITVMDVEPTHIQIYASVIPWGTPVNAVSRVGYGLTEEQASANAGHLASQAPWERISPMTISNRDEPDPGCDDERVARIVCDGQPELGALIQQGRYATAVRIALARGEDDDA